MPKQASSVTHASLLNLHKRFGDSPLGKKRYRVTPSVQRRSPVLQAWFAVKRWGTQVANVMAPDWRALPQAREALRKCSHRVGDVIQALSQPDLQNADAVNQGINACIEASEAVAALPRAGDTQPGAFVQARLEVHLSAMNLAQLVKLKAGLDNAKADACDEDNDVGTDIKDFFITLGNALHQELEVRATQAAHHWLKALAHPSTDMRAPQVLQGCVQRFDTAMAALPLDWPGKKHLLHTVRDRLPEMTTKELSALCAVLRNRLNAKGPSAPKLSTPAPSLVTEADRLLQAVYGNDVPV